VLARFQSSESFGRLQYAGGGPLLREYLVDPQRVYIDGLSGAAATAIMGATSPGFIRNRRTFGPHAAVRFFEFGATNRYSSEPAAPGRELNAPRPAKRAPRRRTPRENLVVASVILSICEKWTYRCRDFMSGGLI
jgi:hypothetical protein